MSIDVALQKVSQKSHVILKVELLVQNRCLGPCDLACSVADLQSPLRSFLNGFFPPMIPQ